jgi:hypothetical protein
MYKRRIRHAAERANQRLGVEYSEHDLVEIEKIIHYGGGTPVQGFSRKDYEDESIVYDLTYKGKEIRVVYKPRTRFVITILQSPPRIGTRLKIPSRR